MVVISILKIHDYCEESEVETLGPFNGQEWWWLWRICSSDLRSSPSRITCSPSSLVRDTSGLSEEILLTMMVKTMMTMRTFMTMMLFMMMMMMIMMIIMTYSEQKSSIGLLFQNWELAHSLPEDIREKPISNPFHIITMWRFNRNGLTISLTIINGVFHA